MTVWIKKEDGEIADDFVFAAYCGFRGGMRTIRFFTKPEKIHYKPHDVVVGDMRDSRYIMKKLGVTLPNFYIPEEVMEFAGREIEKTTVEVASNRKARGEKFFMKPVETKLFPAQVIDGFPFTTYMGQEIKIGWECWVSDIVDFKSEYRVFIIENEIVGCQYYLGDFTVYPDWGVIREVVHTIKNQPAGWTIDFGVDSEGRTLIIETNDGYSIGDYGLWAPTYSKLLETRWKQLTSQGGTFRSRI